MARSDSPDPTTPVLVGVGTAVRPPGSADLEPLEPVDLMHEAAAAAIADAGGLGAAARIGTVAVPVGNWSYADAGRIVADRLGARSARTVRVEVGVSQQTPVRVAVERIARGELEVALVVGGEAMATSRRRARAGLVPSVTDQGDVVADECWSPQDPIVSQAEIDVGMWNAVEHYACIDNAWRSARGDTLDQQLDENAELWHRMNEVASTFPGAAFPELHPVEHLRVPGEGNRPLSHPYAKWHSTQWGVDQAGAMLLCSVAVAKDLGIPADRWVVPRVLVESSSAVPLSERALLHRWPAMAVLGEAAAAHLGHPLSEAEHLELYSCFPSAVKVQQLELGLPPGRTPTVTGGMPFAGGPFNNFTYQATAEVVARVRAAPGSLGVVSTVSGLLTKPALAVWSTDPGDGSLVADLATRADERTARRSVVSEHHGPATVATWTVTWSGSDPAAAFVIADLDPTRRWIGTSTDPALLAAGLGEGLAGVVVAVDGSTCALA